MLVEPGKAGKQPPGVVPVFVSFVTAPIFKGAHSPVIAAQVYPSSVRPHFIKDAGSEQGVYVRVGSTNRRADPAQIEEIRRFVRGRGFDEEPLPEMNTEAIDFRAASESFRSRRKIREGDLRILHLTTSHQNREVPTVGSCLPLGSA